MSLPKGDAMRGALVLSRSSLLITGDCFGLGFDTLRYSTTSPRNDTLRVRIADLLCQCNKFRRYIPAILFPITYQ